MFYKNIGYHLGLLGSGIVVGAVIALFVSSWYLGQELAETRTELREAQVIIARGVQTDRKIADVVKDHQELIGHHQNLLGDHTKMLGEVVLLADLIKELSTQDETLLRLVGELFQLVVDLIPDAAEKKESDALRQKIEEMLKPPPPVDRET